MNLANIGHGEVLLIYNKLNEPFVRNFIKEHIKPERLKEMIDPIRDINTLILAIHPDINMKIIEKLIKDIEAKVDKLNLKYEEKWLLYNYLGHIYLLDLIETIGE